MLVTDSTRTGVIDVFRIEIAVIGELALSIIVDGSACCFKIITSYFSISGLVSLTLIYIGIFIGRYWQQYNVLQ